MINVETIREHCLVKRAVTEEMPFGDDTLVFKVMGKMFILVNLEGNLSINLKCDPELAIELRERYPEVQSGYHMNKKHWNTITFDGSLSDTLIFEWIDHSYDLVVKGLPANKRQELNRF